jgi:hypothetical protein
MYDALTGTNTGTYEQYVAQNGYMPKSTYEATRSLRGDQIPWQDQLRNSMIIPPSTDVQAPVAAPEMSMIKSSIPYKYNVPNEMGFLQNPTGLLANSQFANTPNNNLGAARFGGLLGAPINYAQPNVNTVTPTQNPYQPTQNPNPADILKNMTLSTLFRQMAYTDSPQLNAISNFMSPAFSALDSIPMTNNTQGK